MQFFFGWVEEVKDVGLFSVKMVFFYHLKTIQLDSSLNMMAICPEMSLFSVMMVIFTARFKVYPHVNGKHHQPISVHQKKETWTKLLNVDQQQSYMKSI